MVPLLQLDPLLLSAIVCITLFAGLVHGTLGLGFPMVATPMLAIFFDVRTAILITLLPTVAVNLVSIWRGTDSLHSIRRYWPLVAFVLVGSLLGGWLLAATDPSPFRLALAALILLYLWTSFSGRLPRQLLASNALLAMAVLGFIAGVSAGATNVMVAVLVIYFFSFEVPRETMVPVLNSCFLIGKLSQIAMLSLAGFVSSVLLLETFPLALAAVLALLVGQRLRERIAIATYQRVLHGLLVVLAGILIVQFVFEVH